MRLYLSGAITGTTDYLDRFDHYEQIFAAKGYSVVNPAKVCNNLPKLTHDEYMRICLQMLGCCDLIFAIPGWESSAGAREELIWASRNGIMRIRLYEESEANEDA